MKGAVAQAREEAVLLAWCDGRYRAEAAQFGRRVTKGRRLVRLRNKPEKGSCLRNVRAGDEGVPQSKVIEFASRSLSEEVGESNEGKKKGITQLCNSANLVEGVGSHLGVAQDELLGAPQGPRHQLGAEEARPHKDALAVRAHLTQKRPHKANRRNSGARLVKKTKEKKKAPLRISSNARAHVITKGRFAPFWSFRFVVVTSM